MDGVVRFHAIPDDLLSCLEGLRAMVLATVEPKIKAHCRKDLGASGLNLAKELDLARASNTEFCNLTKFRRRVPRDQFKSLVVELRGLLHASLPDLRGILRLSGYSLYPPGGFLGWHSNHDKPGLRVYCTWSEADGANFFRYEDPRSKEIVTLYEPVGWTVKSFQVPKQDERLWHCIQSDSLRIALGLRLTRSGRADRQVVSRGVSNRRRDVGVTQDQSHLSK